MKSSILVSLLLTLALLFLAACSGRTETNSNEITSSPTSGANKASSPEVSASTEAPRSSDITSLSTPSSSAPDSSSNAPSGPAFGGQSELYPQATIPPSTEAPMPEPVGIYASVLDEYGLDEFATESGVENSSENIAPLEQWTTNYRQRNPGKVALMRHWPPFPIMFIFECDGDESYTISEYGLTFTAGGTSKPELRKVYESSVIIDRTFDYGFGTDFLSENERQPIYIQRTALDETGEIDFNVDWSLQEVSPQEVEDRAFGDLKSILSGGPGAPKVHFKTVGTMEISGIVFFIVYGNTDEEDLNRNEHGGRVRAVSTDLRFVLNQSMEDGDWFLIDDMEQKVITPDSTNPSPPVS